MLPSFLNWIASNAMAVHFPFHVLCHVALHHPHQHKWLAPVTPLFSSAPESAHCHWIYNETHDDNMWRWQSPPVVLAGWLVDGALLNDLINGSVPLLDTISTN